MFERYVIPDQLAAEREFLPVRTWWNFAPKFNVAPTQYVPSVRVHDGETEGMMMRWGLIPSWAEGKPTAEPTAASGMTRITTSPIFKMPWLSGQRCILPAAGFYVWQLTGERYRQPYFVHLINRAVFGLAAIWDRSVGEDDDVVESCTVIQVRANELLGDISNGRMPAILRRRDYETWLKGTPVQAIAALKPYNAEWMQAHAVSPRINSPDADDAGLIAPVH